jgi:hypothetical protein
VADSNTTLFDSPTQTAPESRLYSSQSCSGRNAIRLLHDIFKLKWLTEIAFGDLRFKMK